MTATLTPEIRKALEVAGDQPLELVDPETQARYMVLRADIFARIQPLLQADRLSKEEQRFLLEQAGRRAGWDDPEMDIYDDLARHGVAGSFADDSTLRELCREIYRERDAKLQP